MADHREIVATRICHVTLYRNGALVRREGRGSGQIEVWDLPLLHHSAALRVRPQAGWIRDLREIGALAMDPSEGQRSAKDLELREARGALEENQRSIDLLEARRRALPFKEKGGSAEAPKRPPEAGAVIALSRGVGARMEALDEALIALREARRGLERRLKSLEAVVERDPIPPKVRRGVTFELGGVEAPTPFELEYFISEARWVPTYLLDVSEGRTSLRMDALVAQATGEDWGDVEITVATADLERATTMPELTSWRIGVAQPARKPAWRPLPEDLDALFAGYDRGEAEAAPPPPEVSNLPEPEPLLEEDLSALALEEDWAVEGAAYEAEECYDDGASLTRAGAIKGDISDYMEAFKQMQRAEAPLAKRSAGLMPSFGGGGPGGIGGKATREETPSSIKPPSAEESPLRHLYLRLNGPEEHPRGKLTPVDAHAHLWSLIEDHEVHDIQVLHRAIEALKRAGARLAERPLPDGQRPKPADGFHHLYRSDTRHDVPTDGKWHRLVILRDEAPARTDYRVVPKMSPEVYRYCTVEMSEARPFPNGAMQVHIDGHYRVTTHLDATGGGRALELNLGLEPAIRLVDRVAHTEQADRGLMSSTTRVETRVSLTLRSGLGEAAEVLLFERVPYAGEEDVDVKRLPCDPEPDRLDEDPNGAHLEGALRWRLMLSARGEAHVEYGYAIEFPAKMELTGGNRRD